MDAKREAVRERARRAAERKEQRQRREAIEAGVRRGEVVVDPSRLALSQGYSIPAYVQRGTYQPFPFVCKDCGKHEEWTPHQQKWWYEVAKGDPMSGPARCRACRANERRRKADARRVHLEGVAAKAKKREAERP